MHKYAIEILYSSDNDGSIAVVPELPGSSAPGETEEEALNEVKIAIELWLETAEKGGARGSSAPGKSPPRRAGREQDGGRLRI